METSWCFCKVGDQDTLGTNGHFFVVHHDSREALPEFAFQEEGMTES